MFVSQINLNIIYKIFLGDSGFFGDLEELISSKFKPKMSVEREMN